MLTALLVKRARQVEQLAHARIGDPVDDLAAAALRSGQAAPLQAGVEFESPPTRQPWGTKAVVHDPDGNAIVLQQA